MRSPLGSVNFEIKTETGCVQISMTPTDVAEGIVNSNYGVQKVLKEIVRLRKIKDDALNAKYPHTILERDSYTTQLAELTNRPGFY